MQNNENKGPAVRFGSIKPSFCLQFILFIFLFPNFLVYRAGLGSLSIANPSVKITSSEIVGDYEVFVLEVQDSSVLNTWLENNGFSKFPPEATKMIEDMFFHFKEANPFQSELYSSIGIFNIAYNAVLAVLVIGSILLTIYYCIRKSLGIKISTSKPFIILLISCATGFGLSYAMVGEKTDVYSVERYWHQNFRASLVQLFAIPDNNFSNGEELIELFQREGIDNPITKEPIIIEDSPGNIIFEETGDINQVKICLENGSLYTLF